MNIIMKTKFGSHLYGTNTENSDVDYKGVYIPEIDDLLLGKLSKSISFDTNSTNDKNSKDDIDKEYYSLHYFIELACKGETAALDMLHAPLDFVEHYTDTWKYIQDNRSKFYTKNLKAFVGYARKQAAKYGVKGSRLNAAKELLKLFSTIVPIPSFGTDKLSTIWDLLPTGEYQKFIENSPNGIKQYEICGRILQETVSIEYAFKQIKCFYDNYGERAELAAENKGIDFKAISHALRAAYQVRELLVDNTITFPRPEASFLKEVKTGKLHYKDKIEPILDTLITEMDELATISTLPEKVDRKFWDEFLLKTMKSKIEMDIYGNAC